ncbi:MAG: non-specific endonuclease [Chthonomonadales bacterium]|nr:non-specific endonuclease [Chthonomonadales bacterium]
MYRPNLWRVVKLCFALALGVSVTQGRADMVAQSQMLLGNLDNATSSANNKEHFLIQANQFSLSYNDTLHFPNWVSWHLNAGDVGGTSRGQFQPDTSLPSGFTVITPSDYTRSGYDRGHNCPSADRSDTRANNDAVFKMTNMTPQAHGLNAGPWEQLESYCRTLAKQGNELYIVCGHGFSAPTHDTVGRAQIAVPDFGWKVVVVIPDRSGNDLNRITAQTRVIAVKMPNINTVSKQIWTRYLVTPAQVEQATGLHLFTALPPQVATVLKAKLDTGGSTASTGRAPANARETQTPPAEGGDGKVWVNTKSGAFWRPGTQYYGKTKEGKYMTETEALKAGYHPAGGR